MWYVLIIIIVLGVLAFLRYPVYKRRRSARTDQPRTDQSRQIRPPGTADLDDVDAVRPDIDASALAEARTGVSADVPDGVLADALLDATPEQLQHLFAAVPAEVMAAAMGKDDVQRRPHRAEDLAQLRSVGDSLDELEIWSFGDKN
ncbi:hypothetical protein GCM10022631_31880 [Deinococcus rubellus]|uniref:Magnesium transporter MgtE intracellular domain-containing protein n=1 Tax=Deinococcus rubellus TaxID=1889240 RepID=A0ABY5YHV2_9DEIO|nr:hypothetical protein [Deinococcus rubellus]UWX64700.1 hypothetical protein N0D28_03290 [Deinococcus rubellus]